MATRNFVTTWRNCPVCYRERRSRNGVMLPHNAWQASETGYPQDGQMVACTGTGKPPLPTQVPHRLLFPPKRRTA